MSTAALTVTSYVDAYSHSMMKLKQTVHKLLAFSEMRKEEAVS
jgi:hypothetical protein